MIISQLHDILLDSLTKDLYSNASFFGERLLNENDTEEFRYLLGKAYIGDGKFHKAFQILKDTKSGNCRYLFAQICLKLNKLVEAERALLTDKHFSKNILSIELESVVPNGSAGYYLLGLVCEKLGNRPIDSINAFKKCLDIDPFMWCAYEKMCKLCPQKIDTSKLFSEMNPKVLKFRKNFTNNNSHNNFNLNHNQITPGSLSSNHNQPKDFSLSPDSLNKINSYKFNSIENKSLVQGHGYSHMTGGQSNQVNRFNLINTSTGNNNLDDADAQKSRLQDAVGCNMTPVLNKDKVEDYGNFNYNQPLVKNRDNLKPFTYSNSPNNVMLEFNKTSDIHLNSSSIVTKNKYGDSNIKPFDEHQSCVMFSDLTPNVRNILHGSSINNTDESSIPVNVHQSINQNFIFNNINLSENNRNGNNNNFYINTTNTSFTKSRDQIDQNNKLIPNSFFVNNMQNTNNKFSDVFQLLKHFADIFKSISMYNCEDTINLIKSLPINHQKSGWALSILGRSYFEMAKYKECDKVYKECLKMEPARLEGLEYYSSCLWHLKDQFQLVSLSNHVLEQSHFFAETWIVVGNCYSLQKEHEIAIKFFNRAIQINPKLPYAYTLSGHEYVENESFTQAKLCYSNAISCDDRHFNAWWGLGIIHLKEQNYAEAVKFFRKAININEKSAILNFYLASAYQQNKELGKALIYLNTAEKLDPSNPMIKYQKANILFCNKKIEDSFCILLDLNEKIPKEAAIHILIGKIYKIKKDYTKALSHFNIAIDLDPKDSNLAKSLIEKLYSESDNYMI